MSDDTVRLVWIVSMIVWALGMLTYAGIVDDWDYVPGAIAAPFWPLVAAFALVAGFCAGWMWLSRRIFLAIRPVPPTPDAYQIAAEQEVERLT